jgi:hypothetical protein
LVPIEEEKMMRKVAFGLIMVCVFALLLSACGGKSGDPAAKAVENYLTALVNKDSTSLSALSCADWESSAMLELDSLQAVKTRLEGMKCITSGTDGSTSQVDCQGRIMATYNGEDQALDLSVRAYQVVQQSGDYLVCGYK